MKNVLLVEPDRILSDIYKFSLNQAGYKVAVANNAQTAIVLADSIKPDLIILEIQLVEHSGIEFLYEFRSYIDWQNIPVIINTIVPPNEFKDSYNLLMNELGVKVYLYKPHSSLRGLLSSVEEINLVAA